MTTTQIEMKEILFPADSLYMDFGNHAHIQWHAHFKAVRIKWVNLFMTLSEYKAIGKSALELAASQGGNVWIADQTDSRGFFCKEILDFIEYEMTDMAHGAGIDTVVIIPPETMGLSWTSTKRWYERIQDDHRLSYKICDSMEDCISWIEMHCLQNH